MIDHCADQHHEQYGEQREHDPLRRRIAQQHINDQVEGEWNRETGKGGGEADEHQRAGADQADLHGQHKYARLLIAAEIECTQHQAPANRGDQPVDA